MSQSATTWGQGMPGRSCPGLGARWAAVGGQQGQGTATSGAAASAAFPLPGMSEEPPRRLPSILGSAFSHLFRWRPFRPPREPTLTARCQQQPAQPGPAEQYRRDPHPRPPQQRLQLSQTQRQPPACRARAKSHACGDWLSVALPDDVSFSLIRGFLMTEAGLRIALRPAGSVG